MQCVGIVNALRLGRLEESNRLVCSLTVKFNSITNITPPDAISVTVLSARHWYWFTSVANR
jgi:hypothetical protein